jgi:hypothetical protein
MTIVALRQINFLAPADNEDVIGNALCLRSMNHFTQFLGVGAIGLSYDSCNAAVAIAPHASYDVIGVNAPGPLNFSALYGSSRLFTGLDPTFNQHHLHIAPGRPFSSSFLEEHAEQTAIRTAENQGLAFWNHGGHHHIYIDLSPCFNCGPWLAGHPDNWFVHYYANLAVQKPVVLFKKQLRVRKFGRMNEPRKRVPIKGITKPSHTRRGIKTR